jgi:hypothetical protein
MATVSLQRASFVLLIAAAACGSSKPGFEAGDASSRGGEGGPSPSGGGGAGGTITVQQSEDLSSGMPTYNGLVSAFFLPDTASAADPSCTTTTAGSCQVQVCEASDAGPSSTIGSVSAGTIGVTGISPIPAMLIPDPDGNYEPFNTQSTAGPIILPNSTVQFDVSGAGAGGGVPAFKASVPIGGLLTITSPKVSGLTTQFPSGGDVPFAWTGGIASDRLQVFLSGSLGSDSSKSVNVTCAFSGGSGTVPAGAMAMMGNTGSMGAGPLATTSVTAGSYDVTIDVQAITVVALFSK